MAIRPSTQRGGTIFFYSRHGPCAFMSQHYACAFTAPSPVEGEPDMTFTSAEQYMTWHKAMLFEDRQIADAILAAETPGRQKRLGRKVRGFDQAVWESKREEIVRDGNFYKFSNGVGGEDIRVKLIDTGDAELVEAAPTDKIWGIGFNAAHAEANRPRWGLNLLGKALMRVREDLKSLKD